MSAFLHGARYDAGASAGERSCPDLPGCVWRWARLAGGLTAGAGSHRIPHRRSETGRLPVPAPSSEGEFVPLARSTRMRAPRAVRAARRHRGVLKRHTRMNYNLRDGDLPTVLAEGRLVADETMHAFGRLSV